VQQTQLKISQIVNLSILYTFLLSLLLTNHQEPLIERVSEPRICTQNIEDNMVAGSPHLDFKDAMEAEHCKQAGCNEEFETINYRIQRRVSGAFEWAVNNGIFPA
jgi:hypothetical protein